MYEFTDFFSGIKFLDFEQKFFGKLPLEGICSEHLLNILSWSDINNILKNSNLEYPRLRLSLKNQIISEKEYTFIERRKRTITKYVDPKLLRNLLNKGAVLIIDSIDELIPKVNNVAGILSDVFKENIQVNCYIGGINSEGFGVHYDDHDVIVVQIFGEKYWEVRSFSRKDPLKNGIMENSVIPEEILISKSLKSRDTLYIPRGFWHKAYSKESLTCHLTFGINNRTKIDFMEYLLYICKKDPFFRENLPKSNYSKEDTEVILSNFNKIIRDITLDDFWSNYESGLTNKRVDHSLPFGLFFNHEDLELTYLVKLSFERRPKLIVLKDTFYFEIMNKRWTFDILVYDFFLTLWSTYDFLSLKNLFSNLNNISLEEFKLLITNLIENNILIMRDII